MSENAPTNALAYGDMSGLYVKLAQNVEIAILNELYATQHATGVVGYVEFDSRVMTRLKNRYYGDSGRLRLIKPK